MESLGHAFSLLAGSSGEGTKWTFSIYAGRVFESADPDAVEVTLEGDGTTVRAEVQELDVMDLLGPYSSRSIISCTEWRMKLNEMQWYTHTFYHAFLMLEVQGGYAICTEKYSDKLELMLGRSDLMRAYATQLGPSGRPRRTTFEQERFELEQTVNVGDLAEWINGPLAMVWKPYDIIFSNCQGYVADMQRFFNDPGEAYRPCEDRAIMMMAVQQNGLMLRRASEALRRDRGLVLAAVAQNGCALEHASEDLKRNRAVVFAALQQSGASLQHVAEDIRGDPECVLAAVSQNGSAIQFAPQSFKMDCDIMEAAMQQCGGFEGLLNDELRQDRDIVLTAVRKDGFALQFADEALKADRKVVRTAMQQRGDFAGLFRCESLRRDRDVVMAAVSIDGFALQYVDVELRRDRAIVREAVRQNCDAIEFAAEELQRDREFKGGR